MAMLVLNVNGKYIYCKLMSLLSSVNNLFLNSPMELHVWALHFFTNMFVSKEIKTPKIFHSQHFINFSYVEIR